MSTEDAEVAELPENETRDPDKCTSVGNRQKKSARRRRAKAWTYYIENLKSTVDGLYEMCREEQNLNGCKEALMYLQNSARDFESLIESIHVELSWEEKEKPQAVAWEVRKTMSSPSHAMKESSLIDVLPPLMFSEVVKAASSRREAILVQAVDALTRECDSPIQGEGECMVTGDDWQVVKGRRRRSLSSLTDDSRNEEEKKGRIEEKEPSIRPSNVYERLASSIKRYPSGDRKLTCRRDSATTSLSSSSLPVSTGGTISPDGHPAGQGGNYMCPRSAMDLPQTKASMAKMAYSRQLLWERSQSSLMEKMKARHARYRNVDFSSSAPRRPTSATGSGRTREEGSTGRTSNTRQFQRKASTPLSSDMDRRSLGSIRETEERREDEEERDKEAIPSDPKPSNHSSLIPPSPKKGTVSPSVPSPPMNYHSKNEDEESASLLSSLPVDDVIDLEADREWREMTEEEESLAFEERSLNIEIEQEQSLSIDAELERQVACEAEGIEEEERLESERMKEKEKEQEKKKPSPSDIGALQLKPLVTAALVDLFHKWEPSVREFENMSWSEFEEKQFEIKNGLTHLREPGEGAIRHERMLSPSRRRCAKDDGDLSRRHEEKQKRADELRDKLQQEKTARLKGLLQKVEEVREKKAAVIERKRIHMEARLRKAEEKREKNIEEIVRRAREDEQKVLEVQLCNTLETNNMRLDQQMKEQMTENRRQNIAEERARKMEGKAAKDAAVEERRRNQEKKREEQLELNNEETLKEKEEDVEEDEKEEKKEPIAHDWSFILNGLKNRLPRDESTEGERTRTRRFECTSCGGVQLTCEWEAIAHCIEVKRHEDVVLGENGITPEALMNELQQCMIVIESREGSADGMMREGEDNSSTTSSIRTRRKKQKKRAAAALSRVGKESVEGLSRAVGGRHGPSVDGWKTLLNTSQCRLHDEDALKETQLFARSCQGKTQNEALDAFLAEFARDEPSQNSELVLLTVVEAALRVCCRDKSTVEDDCIEFEKLLLALIVRMVDKTRVAFKRVFSTGVHELKLLSVLLGRLSIDSCSLNKNSSPFSIPLNSTNSIVSQDTQNKRSLEQSTHTRIVLKLLASVVDLSHKHQLLCCVLLGPSILASFPISFLSVPALRTQLMPTVIAATVNCDKATSQLERTLSARHCIHFLKALERDTPLSRLTPIVETSLKRERWTHARQYYEQYIANKYL